MEQQTNSSKKNNLFLLNSSYRRIGYWITAFAILVLLVKKIGAFTLQFAGDTNKPDAGMISAYIALIIGLMTIAWSEEKIEDEWNMMNRFKAISIAFILGVLYVIIIPLIELSGGHLPNPLSSIELVIGMLLVYMVVYSMLKKMHA